MLTIRDKRDLFTLACMDASPSGSTVMNGFLLDCPKRFSSLTVWVVWSPYSIQSVILKGKKIIGNRIHEMRLVLTSMSDLLNEVLMATLFDEIVDIKPC